MRNGIEVMSLLYLRGAETDSSHVSAQVKHLDQHKGPEESPVPTSL